tara:strand:- start:405 stop:770 length:366 start_codon:yes stop_codon:yes gene_type:complete
MAKSTNAKVIARFLKGQPAKSNNMLSARDQHGELCLYSYCLKIARYTGDGAGMGDTYYLYDYRAGALGMRSITTSQHVGLLHRMAAEETKCGGALEYKSVESIWCMDNNRVDRTVVDYRMS